MLSPITVQTARTCKARSLYDKRKQGKEKAIFPLVAGVSDHISQLSLTEQG